MATATDPVARHRGHRQALSGLVGPLTLVLVVVALGACSPRTADKGLSVSEPFLPTGVATEVLALVNEARSAPVTCGTQQLPAAGPLVLEQRLSSAAQGHSEDMYEHGFMGHGGSDGSNFIQRAERSGYGWSALAENVAYGYTEPATVVAGWLGSPGHCVNIMNSQVTELGVGLEGTYWTQLFGAPAFSDRQ